MSPKLKTGLIVGGICLAALVICGVIGLAVLGPRIGRSYSNIVSSAGYDYAQEAEYYGVGGGGAPAALPAAPTAAYVEAPAAERQAVYGAADTSTINTGVQQSQQVERLIIRTGNISIQVEDTRAAQSAIEQMVAQMAGEGAFVVTSNEYGGSPGSSPYIDMTIRVPATRFDEVMSTIEALAVAGTNPSISTSAEDVTAQYVDLQARTQALEAARDRLMELMQGAETTEDVLMAEQQLTYREAELESMKGQMQYLAEAARLSLISIQLQPYILSQPVDTRWRPAETVRQAFDSLVDSARDFGDFLIFFAIAVLPWLLLFAAIIYGIVRFILWRVRVGQRKRAAVQAAQQAER